MNFDFTGSPRLRRWATFSTLLALAAVFAATTLAVGSGGRGSGSGGDRYEQMPDPKALDGPFTAGASDQMASFTIGRDTMRLFGTQTLYRIDSASSAITEARPVELRGAVFQTAADSQTFGGRQFLEITSGPYAGWWAETPDSAPAFASRRLTQRQVKLAPGRSVGVRFYAKGTLRTRRPVFLASAQAFDVSRRAVFNGRTFYLISNGPLAERWVAERTGVTLLTAQSRSAPAPTDQPPADTPPVEPTAAPTTPPPSTQPIDQPIAAPEPTPTEPAPTATPAATWRGLVLVYRDTDVNYVSADGSAHHLQVRMSDQMHDLTLDTVGRFGNSVQTWSGGLAEMNLDVVDVPHALTSLDSLGSSYWVGPRSVEADLNQYAPTGTYDSIFVVWQARDAAGQQVPVGGWGLTLPPGSWANGAGYTSIITPSAMWWWTESRAPEEVFIHEWMHQVLYWNHANGRSSLDLHAGSSYGYDGNDGTWRRWLSDVMQGRVLDGDHYTGVNAEMWAAGKPSAP